MLASRIKQHKEIDSFAFRQKTSKMASVFVLALFSLAAFNGIDAGKPTLSDNLGLYNYEEFVGVGKNYVTGSVWPKPQSETKGSKMFAVNPKLFKFSSVGQQSSVLSQAIARYHPLTFPDEEVLTEMTMQIIASLEIKVLDAYEPISLETDESCEFAFQIGLNTTVLALYFS